MPKTVYRERDLGAAQVEASAIKARIRGEVPAPAEGAEGAKNVSLSYPRGPNDHKEGGAK